MDFTEFFFNKMEVLYHIRPYFAGIVPEIPIELCKQRAQSHGYHPMRGSAPATAQQLRFGPPNKANKAPARGRTTGDVALKS